MDTREIGRQGEKIAEGFLLTRGYKIIARNFWCSLGEIDLIAIDGQYTVFIEVKTVRNDTFFPEKKIDLNKQKRIIKVASYYIKKLNITTNYRFDVVIVRRKHLDNEIKLIKNAFSVNL